MGKLFKIDVIVRWHDTDMAGVMYFGNYLNYLEVAENELYRAAGWTESGIYRELGVQFPRISINCDYKSPAVLDDILELSLFVPKITRTTFTFDFEYRKKTENLLVAKGHMTLCCIDMKNARPTRVPDKFLDLLMPYYVKEGEPDPRAAERGDTGAHHKAIWPKMAR